MSVLSELTCSHIFDVESSEFSLSPRLLGSSARIKPELLATLRETFGTDDIKLGRRARFSEWGLCEVGDVAYVSMPSGCIAGKISFAVEADSCLHFGIALWVAAGDSAEGSVLHWDTSCVTNVVVEASRIVDLLVWRSVGVAVQTLRPC